MRTIGLIGGMSWESSKVYYEYLNKLAQKEMGGSHSARIIMSSVDFSEIEKYSFEGNWNAIGELMALHATKLEKAGADMIVLCTNTIHLVSDVIENSISVPFLHIADGTGKAIEKQGLNKIALLGTQFTMEKDFYTRILKEKFSLEVLIPELADRVFLQDVIYNELVKGQFTNASKQTMIEIIKELQDQGAEGVILGCTELPILISRSDVEIPIFDTGKIHAHAAIEWSLNDASK